MIIFTTCLLVQSVKYVFFQIFSFLEISIFSKISSAFGLPLKDDGINALVKETQNCRAVLIGEMTHGSEEFYETRSQITKRVLENNEEDTWVVALEAGYAQVEIINDFVQGKREFLPDDWSQKFPKWLWRNSVCLSFFEWARNARKAGQKIQILGMDLYGMFDSIDRVVEEVTKLHDEKMLALVMKNYEQLIMLQKQGIEESRYRDSGLVLEKVNSLSFSIRFVALPLFLFLFCFCFVLF